ncbi:unknown [Feldmannia species virus]|uniref:Uncharacterized protein n=1 Tax=Feldmannia species virus TaxID=39420 RepID=B5LWB6_9PHYC|nr:hypothetical protein FeldSpV_gp027 [Feldmannia species virus]ACH46779.1 unknown [Feldmannia species virus]
MASEADQFKACLNRKLLVQELSKLQLTLRPDSRLCSGFIEGTLDDRWDLERVVHECALMNWLFVYTDYPQRLEEAFRFFSDFLPTGKAVQAFVREKVQPVIKFGTISKCGGIPSRWPWLGPASLHG